MWLARTVLGEYRAVKVVYRRAFGDNRPFQREFEGIQRYEPISRSHPSQVQILHVGINEPGGYFYYVMELADDAEPGRHAVPDRPTERGACRTCAEQDEDGCRGGFDQALGGYVANITEERLKGAPKYRDDSSWNWSDQATASRVNKYYENMLI